jgi:hypothetical protein
MTVPPKGKVFGDLVTMAYVDSLLQPVADVTKGVTKVIDGVPAVALVSPRQTVDVATIGEPYPLRLDRTELERLSFSELGVAFPQIQAPAPAEVAGAVPTAKA